MRVLLLAVVLSMPVLAEDTKPVTPPPADVKAACMKACAGAPREATPQRLMACLTACESPADAGVPAPR